MIKFTLYLEKTPKGISHCKTVLGMTAVSKHPPSPMTAPLLGQERLTPLGPLPSNPSTLSDSSGEEELRSPHTILFCQYQGSVEGAHKQAGTLPTLREIRPKAIWLEMRCYFPFPFLKGKRKKKTKPERWEEAKLLSKLKITGLSSRRSYVRANEPVCPEEVESSSW